MILVFRMRSRGGNRLLPPSRTLGSSKDLGGQPCMVASRCSLARGGLVGWCWPEKERTSKNSKVEVPKWEKQERLVR